MKKTACVPELRAQADSKIGESLFHDCFNGAVVNTGAAVNADISVDDIGLVALRNSLNRAVISAAAALDACISDLVHDFPSKFVMIVRQSFDAPIF